MNIKANLLRSIDDWSDGWPIDGAPLAETLERFAVPELIAEFRKAQAAMPPLEPGRTWPTWVNSPWLPGEEVPVPVQRVRDATYACVTPVIDAWNAGALRATGKRNCDAYAAATEIPAPANLWAIRLIDVEHSIINDPSGGAILDLRFFVVGEITPLTVREWLTIAVDDLMNDPNNHLKGVTAIGKILYPKMIADHERGKVERVSADVRTIVKRLRDYKLWPLMRPKQAQRLEAFSR
jgi:hypothetical protein